jgi:hypothetical protein
MRQTRGNSRWSLWQGGVALGSLELCSFEFRCAACVASMGVGIQKDQKRSHLTFPPTWWLWRSGCTRSHPELGRETLQRQWYCVLRRGRVGRRQVCRKVRRLRQAKSSEVIIPSFNVHPKTARASSPGRFLFVRYLGTQVRASSASRRRARSASSKEPSRARATQPCSGRYFCGSYSVMPSLSTPAV